MPADRDVPPTRLQRWFVDYPRRAKALSLIFLGLAVAYAVVSILSHGWDMWGSWVSLLAGATSWVMVTWGSIGSSRQHVEQYDRRHSPTD